MEIATALVTLSNKALKRLGVSDDDLRRGNIKTCFIVTNIKYAKYSVFVIMIHDKVFRSMLVKTGHDVVENFRFGDYDLEAILEGTIIETTFPTTEEIQIVNTKDILNGKHFWMDFKLRCNIRSVGPYMKDDIVNFYRARGNDNGTVKCMALHYLAYELLHQNIQKKLNADTNGTVDSIDSVVSMESSKPSKQHITPVISSKSVTTDTSDIETYISDQCTPTQPDPVTTIQQLPSNVQQILARHSVGSNTTIEHHPLLVNETSKVNNINRFISKPESEHGRTKDDSIIKTTKATLKKSNTCEDLSNTIKDNVDDWLSHIMETNKMASTQRSFSAECVTSPVITDNTPPVFNSKPTQPAKQPLTLHTVIPALGLLQKQLPKFVPQSSVRIDEIASDVTSDICSTKHSYLSHISDNSNITGLTSVTSKRYNIRSPSRDSIVIEETYKGSLASGNPFSGTISHAITAHSLSPSPIQVTNPMTRCVNNVVYTHNQPGNMNEITGARFNYSEFPTFQQYSQQLQSQQQVIDDDEDFELTSVATTLEELEGKIDMSKPQNVLMFANAMKARDLFTQLPVDDIQFTLHSI